MDKLRPSEPELDIFRSIPETCARFDIGKSTFYRSFRDPESGLEDLCVRFPPVTGVVRVPQLAFEAWLRGRPAKARRARAS